MDDLSLHAGLTSLEHQDGAAGATASSSLTKRRREGICVC